ncbi:TonB-dependent receptor [Gammaproteobacteria bacterium]|nr:TonB-dependent receptor [Gammaproteobacteria bacterium]
MYKYLLTLMVLLPLSTFTVAQEAEEAKNSEVEEVVTTGIRSSLIDAISIKRENVGVMEAITAEDFGKFPDGNLAESLARISGVGIDRSNLEGEGVAVRGFGPELNLVTLNGRQMPTVPAQYGGGRSFNFGDIASPGISAVELYKSTNNSLPSGGIGSTINMVTTKPLQVDGTKSSFSVGYVHDTSSTKSETPEISVLYATNRDYWGFSFSGSYQDRNNREEGTRESNWFIPSRLASEELYSRLDIYDQTIGQTLVDNNTRADGITFYQEPTSYQIKDNDRLRKNAQLTFQWVFSDKLVSTFDYTYSGVEFSSVGQMFGTWLGAWDTLEGTINSNGVFTDVVVGNRSYDHQLIWGDTTSANRSIGMNHEFVVNDALTITFDAHTSSASKNGTELPNEMAIGTNKKSTVTHLNGGSSGINSFSFADTYESSDYYLGGLLARDAYKKNEMNQYQLIGEWVNLDDGIIKSIDFGVSKIVSKFKDRRYEENNQLIGASADDFADSLFVKTDLGDFMDGFNTELGTSYYFAVDKDAAVAAFVAAGGSLNVGPIDLNERIQENLDSAFIQFNMETEYNGRPLNIVAGLRYETSDTVSTSLESAPTIIRVDYINGLDYIRGDVLDVPKMGTTEDFLPSLAISYSLSENEVLRFSASKTLARPSLQDKRSGFVYGNVDFWNPTADGGNPDLESLKSTNFDLAYENYYAEGSYYAVNIFRKEITDFISNDTRYDNLFGLTNAAYGEIIMAARACTEEWVQAGRPDTVSYDVPGAWTYCVSQQSLWGQPDLSDDYRQAMWVALGMAAHGGTLPELWNNGWAFGWGSSPNCNDGGWWRCNPGYIDSTSNDPLALFRITQPKNLEEGDVSGIELTLQHLFEGTPYGVQFNYTKITGGDVDIDRDDVGPQFILPGFGDAGNLSVFYEDNKHTFRVAANYRGETVAGFGNYEQPLYVEERLQIDATYQYRVSENTTIFLDMMNINDETTRLHARYSEMLFLSQDHGPIYKFGFRSNF